jgi:uncharacterized protein (DUF58 family)
MRRASLAAGLGLALCLTAAGFAVASLYVPGVALLLVAGGAVAWVSLATRNVWVARSTGMPAVEENVALAVTVRVLRSHLPLPGAELRAWSGGPLLTLPRSPDATVTADVRFPRRGHHRLGPASLLVSDPLDVCRREVLSAADEVLVLPRVEPVRFEGADGEAMVLGRTAPRGADADATEVDGLRPHRPATPASRIHWPTVARTTTLIERRLVADADQRPLVVVDPRERSSADALDRAVRAAASLCVHLARQGGCALLLAGDRRPVPLGPELHGWRELHARLALLQPHDGAAPVAGLAHADAVLWVTAAAGLPIGLTRIRAPMRYLVSPHPQAGRPVEFTVAGCCGQRLERAPARKRAT